MTILLDLLNSQKYRERVQQLLTEEERNLPTKRADFESKMKDLIRSIELGNILKGKCKDCP